MPGRDFYKDKSLEELAELTSTTIPMLGPSLETEFRYRQTMYLERATIAQEKSAKQMALSVLVLALSALGTFIIALCA